MTGVLARNNPDSPIRVIVTSIVLFCFSLLLTAYSSKNPELGQIGSAVLRELVLPVQLAATRGVHAVSDTAQNYLFLVGLRGENETLRGRVNELEAERVKLLEYKHENERLMKLYGTVEQHSLSGIPAAVIGYNPSNWIRTITIDRGLADGVENDLAVVADSGLVGKVVKVSHSSADVLLITDHASGVDAMVQRTRARGIVTGLSEELCRMLYVEDREQLKKGDVIISSGIDGVYPKGVMVGKIARFTHNGRGKFQNVQLSPAVDFSRLENVFVVKAERGPVSVKR